MTLPGVGRKTATLVMILAFQSRRHICVDTHVHRISNRLGWVKTATPEETEQALYRSTDARWWPFLNLYLVTWGQNVCRPVYPRCECVRHRRHLPQARCPASHAARLRVPAARSRPRRRRTTMNNGLRILLIAVASLTCAARALAGEAQAPAASGRPAPTSPGAGPVIVVETVKGTFEFETYPNEAPKTVARIVELVNKRFYNGLRVHRVVPNFVMQLGDPTTRDMTRQADWGRYGSGTPIGVAEITKTRTHVRGAVAMAHGDDATKADSQCVCGVDAAQPRLDGKYTVFGKVISGHGRGHQAGGDGSIIRVTVRGAT